MINVIFDWLIKLTGNVDLVVVLVAVLPMAEARLAIPVALKYGVSPFKAFLLGFIGSTAAAALLLLCLLPLIRLVSKAKIFKKLADSILTKAENKAKKMSGKAGGAGTDNDGYNGSGAGSDLKKMLGICGFVSLPLPLTGVYMGSLLASILGLKYHKALISIAIGNLITSAIITVTGVYFAEYINIMVAVLTVTALLALVLMLIKAFLPFKKDRKNKA